MKGIQVEWYTSLLMNGIGTELYVVCMNVIQVLNGEGQPYAAGRP